MKKTLALILCLITVFVSIPFTTVSAADKAQYLKGDVQTLNGYLAKAEALKNEIINSPTDIKYTGKTYYISHKGNDNNDGLTPETAWYSPLKVSNAAFLASGDAVLFERGGTYRYDDTIVLKSGVTYSAYGSGAKPRLIGSIDASSAKDWEETRFENVYKYAKPIQKDVGVIIFDNGAANGIKITNGVFVGEVSNGLETYDAGTRTVSDAGALKNDLEFWSDTEGDALYLYSKGENPASRFASIEISDYDHGMRGGSQTDITIDNLDFFGFAAHGISFGSTKNLTVQNCTFSWIGGGIHVAGTSTRLGNAVEIYGTCDGFIIRNCYATQIYDCCWTVQWSGDSMGKDIAFKNFEFYNNVASYCNTGLEVWLAGRTDKDDGVKYTIENMNLHDNYTLYNGYGWSHQRPNKDANFFYGATGTGIDYINCSVHDNVGIFTSKNVLLASYVGSNAYNFNNNVYFQDPDLYLGGVAANPEQGGNRGEYKYDAATMKQMIDTGFEAGTKFYYMDGYDIPKPFVDRASFTDMPEGHWASEYVNKAYIRNYFKGTTDTTFSPDTSMTRAMLATVLSRIADFSVKSEPAPYTDINKDAWYADAVNWAYNAGIVDKALTEFRPDAAATREEMADMLYRFTLSQNKTAPISEPSLTFSDAASVSPEYASGIAFAVNNGIISGYTDKSVKPKNTATRAEVAAMLTRFADLYKTLETTYASGKTDHHIFSGVSLSAMAQAFNGEKRTGKDGQTELVQMLPPELTYTPPALHVFERLSKISFADYPYVKVRSRTDYGASTYTIKLKKGEQVGEITPASELGRWHNEIFCVYDILSPDKADYSVNDGTIILSPWQELNYQTYPKRGEDTYDIEYIGFFPSREAAEAYQSEREKSSVSVSCTVDGEDFATVQLTRGTAFVYPEKTPVKNGWAFEKWSIAEGTIINEDTTAEAIFVRREGEPVALFDTTNANYSSSGTIDKAIAEENGIKYFHFTVSADNTSADGTRTNIILSPADYDVSVSKVMKIKYRTNVASSSGIDLNLWLTTSSRIWGPKITYTDKGKWTEAVFDMSTIGFNGGENIDTSVDKSEIFNANAKGNIVMVTLKPYHTTGLAMKQGEYFDVAYVAFFDSVKDAENYKG
ncbi:MAG: S-layer homology domain-containing protein [Clostridia bacterium]|nr:S-layer homology domain-containing protein [Clostridia bacterium]